MKRLYIYCATLVVVVIISIVYATSMRSEDNFWGDAAQVSITEATLGNLALQKSEDDAVKRFAQQIVNDHSAANQNLTDLAAKKNVALPSDVNNSQQAVIERLSGLSGSAFDEQFEKQMVSDHVKAVSLFKRASDSSPDANVKEFAAKVLPSLQQHLSTATELSLKASK